MSGVFLCSATNSTMFTTCCETAICDDEQKCPSCGEFVHPFDEYMTDKERDKISSGYFNSNVRELRWKSAFRR